MIELKRHLMANRLRSHLPDECSTARLWKRL